MKELLGQLIRGSPLTFSQAEAAFTDLMEGTADAAQAASLLTLLATREPTVEELQGAATVMRRHMVAIDAPERVIDTCSTGGVGSRFFNISTTVALVAAAAGVPVAKHGNRSVTSRSGSADVLRVLGVNIDTTPEQESRCLREVGMCFAFAPRHHTATQRVAPIRQALGFATIFNLLGPLTNPAGARRQVVGTRSAGLADKMLDVLVRLGAQRVMAVAGTDTGVGPICDISISGPTHVALFSEAAANTAKRTEPSAEGSSGGKGSAGEAGELAGGRELRRLSLVPENLGLRTRNHVEAELAVRSPEESASRLRNVLAGKDRGAGRDMVLANTAAALWVGEAVADLPEGVRRAGEVIDSGAALTTLERLIACSHQPA